jgi:hypothetical protein
MSGAYKGSLENQLGANPSKKLKALLKEHHSANQVARVCNVSRQAVAGCLSKYGFTYDGNEWVQPTKTELNRLCQSVGVAKTAQKLKINKSYIRQITNRVE